MSPLCNCPQCRSPYVQPEEWTELPVKATGPTSCTWLMFLVCANCQHRFEMTTTDEQAKEYDRALDAGAEEVRKLVIDAEVERFAAALDADAIVPFDFGVSA